MPLAGAARGSAGWMALARPAAAGQFVFVALAFGILAYAFSARRFLACCTSPSTPTRRCRRSTNSRPCGVATKGRCCCGSSCSRSGRWPWRAEPRAARRVLEPRARRARPRQRGIIAFIALHVESVRSTGRPRSTATTSIRCCKIRHGHAPADAVLGLCRHGGAVRVRRRRAVVRAGSTRTGRAGRGHGRSSRGCFSRSASRSAAGGRTTSSAGAVGGSGIRSRTRRSCRG